MEKVMYACDPQQWTYVPQSTNRFVYDGWNLAVRLASDLGPLASFTWGLDLSGSLHGAGGVGGLLSITVHTGPNTGTYFSCYDGNGNVMGLINAADGSVAARYEYGPFGELLRATGPLAKTNPFRFSTKYQDEETGLLYYGYRYYDPITGRWPNRDPIEEKGGLNLYGFVRNEPVSLYDALGQAPCGTKQLAACMATCLAWAGQHYDSVRCSQKRNPWTLGLCWKVECRCVTKCYLKDSIPIGNKLICQYHCPMRHTKPGDYAVLIVPAAEGCPQKTTDGGDPTF